MFAFFKKMPAWWLLLFLAGCAGPKADSTAHFSQDPNYTGRLSRPLMMYPEADASLGLPHDYAQQLFEHIAEELGAHDVPSAILRLNAEKEQRTKQMKLVSERFNPSHVVYLKPDRKAGHQLTLTLRDVAGGKVIWRFEKAYPSWPPPEEVAQEVLKQWRSAQLIDRAK